jgi:glycosyltransferase involved in cell wall biosynthesis
MKRPSVSIVVPALNEARNLEHVLPALPDVHEVILVDGGSIDGTVETAHRVRPGIIAVQQTRRGKGNALACGFELATGDIIVMFDADGSADPAEIPRFVDALIAGADFAKGSRFCSGPAGQGSSEDITALRQAGNTGLNWLANLLFNTRYSDLCYGYNAFWRRVLPVLRLPPSTITPRGPGALLWGDGFEIESVISCRVAAAGLRVTEVPSTERLRTFGETNLRTFADGFRVLRTLIAERAASLRRTRPGGAPASVTSVSNLDRETTVPLSVVPRIGDVGEVAPEGRAG